MRRSWILFLLAWLLLAPLSSGEAAMGKVVDFSFRGISQDLTGPEGPFRPDGIGDAQFSLAFDGIGALASLSVRRHSDGFEWTPGKGAGFHGIRVRDTAGTDLSEVDGTLPLLPFLGRLSLELYLPLAGEADFPQGDYTVTARFVDGSEATGTARIDETSRPDTSEPTERKITRARFLPLTATAHDVVGPGEKPEPGGKDDRGIELELEGQGQVRAISVRTVSGRFAAWDTLPSNRRWLVGVEQEGKTLNEADGGVAFSIRGQTGLTLWLEDNGAVQAGDSTFEVTVRFSDGLELRELVSPPPSDETLSPGEGLTFVGQGARDLVGLEEALGSDGRPDWQFRLGINTRGTLIGLTLLGEQEDAPAWDTLPGNRIPLVAVTDSSGRILNRQNGSLNLPLYGETTLHLWVGDRGSRLQSRNDLRAKAVFEDGRVLEYSTVAEDPHGEKERLHPQVTMEARYLGRQNSDRVSESAVLIGDGLPDSRIRIYMEMPVRGMRLQELTVTGMDESSPVWSTSPGRNRWAILVTDPAGDILNGTDGTILLDLEEKVQLSLWLADRGRLERGESPFMLRALFEKGDMVETPLLR